MSAWARYRDSACAKYGNAPLLLYVHLCEARGEPIPKRLHVVTAIIEDAPLVVEAEQHARDRIRCDAFAENRRTEQRALLRHHRAQLIDGGQLLRHAARQTVQDIGQADAVDRLDI